MWKSRCSTKSAPGGMVSMSMNTVPGPKCSTSRSRSRWGTYGVSFRRYEMKTCGITTSSTKLTRRESGFTGRAGGGTPASSR